ncbi:uncharacterized protein LOC144307959 [Canis aureus]
MLPPGTHNRVQVLRAMRIQPYDSKAFMPPLLLEKTIAWWRKELWYNNAGCPFQLQDARSSMLPTMVRRSSGDFFRLWVHCCFSWKPDKVRAQNLSYAGLPSWAPTYTHSLTLGLQDSQKGPG